MIKIKKIQTLGFMISKIIVVSIFIIGILSSCSKERDVNNVNIRISNISDLNFENIKVGTSSVKFIDYGDLETNALSDFKNFEKAYRIAFVDLIADGKPYSITPVDYIGETPLSDGNYTYVLDLAGREDGIKELMINLIEE